MAVQSVLGPGGYPRQPYGSFAGKVEATGGAVVIPFGVHLKARFMAIRNQALTVNFLAWDTNANVGKTGDSANFTLRLINDGGTAAAPTNAISEPDSTNLPGVYEIALTAGEMDADFVTLGGVSSTANIVIYPLFITTESGDLAVIDGNVDSILTDTGTTLPASLATIDTNVDAVLVDTGTTLPASISGLNDPTAAAIRAEMDSNSTQLAAIVADTNELQSDDVPGLIAALNDISSANVLTQVNAALDTAISELSQGIPTATPTMRTGLMLLYMALRNRLDVNTSGTDELAVYNDAGTKIARKLLTDDGSDYSEAEMTSGA